MVNPPEDGHPFMASQILRLYPDYRATQTAFLRVMQINSTQLNEL